MRDDVRWIVLFYLRDNEYEIII